MGGLLTYSAKLRVWPREVSRLVLRWHGVLNGGWSRDFKRLIGVRRRVADDVFGWVLTQPQQLLERTTAVGGPWWVRGIQ